MMPTIPVKPIPTTPPSGPTKAIPYVTEPTGPSKSDLFFQGLENAQVYYNRPDEVTRGRRQGDATVSTQYIFSPNNPFIPKKGQYFMSEANTRGKRKTYGDLDKAREWEREYGLGTQADLEGYNVGNTFKHGGFAAFFASDYDKYVKKEDGGTSDKDIATTVTLPDVEISALTDETYDKLSQAQKYLYSSYIDKDGAVKQTQAVTLGRDNPMKTHIHWKDALNLAARNPRTQIRNKPYLYPTPFSMSTTGRGKFRPHYSPFTGNVYVPSRHALDESRGYVYIDEYGYPRQYYDDMSKEADKKHMENIFAEYAHADSDVNHPMQNIFGLAISGVDKLRRAVKERGIPDASDYESNFHYEYHTHHSPKSKEFNPMISERQRYRNFLMREEAGKEYMKTIDSAIKKPGGGYYKAFENGLYYPYIIEGENEATIGYGRKRANVLKDYAGGITEEQALKFMDEDIDNALRLAKIYVEENEKSPMYGDVGSFGRLDSATQYMLADYPYNVGRLSKFPSFAKAVLTNDPVGAEKEYKRVKDKSTNVPLKRNVGFYKEYVQPFIQSITGYPDFNISNQKELDIKIKPQDM